MPPGCTVGHNAFNPADAHGCPACPHPVTGPGTAGSPTVMAEKKPVHRVGDMGAHAACCGPNMWNSAKGSTTVMVNGIPWARLGDMTAHCGGVGQHIVGCGTVIVGG